MNFACSALSWGRLWLHPIYRWLNTHTPVEARDQKIPTTCQLTTALAPWTRLKPSRDAVELKLLTKFHLIMTDASNLGYGASWNKELLSGLWNPKDKIKHINWKELRTITLAFGKWAGFWRNSHVRVLSDNMTAVACLNHQGSAHFPLLHEQVFQIWEICAAFQIQLSVEFLPGWLNVRADSLSRTKPVQTEWSLDKKTFSWINQQFGPLLVDLCATEENTQLAQFVSPYPCEQAVGQNILTIDWSVWKTRYLFPPCKLIPLLLPLLKQHQKHTILVAPLWTNQDWFLPLKQIFNRVTKLPPYKLLQTVGARKVHHPTPEFWDLHMWHSSEGH